MELVRRVEPEQERGRGKRERKERERKVNSHSSTHNPRGIRIHGDIVFCHFHGICLRQTAHGPFGCAVMREEGKRFESDNGRTLEKEEEEKLEKKNTEGSSVI